jgi:Protein of unknown function, DUF481
MTPFLVVEPVDLGGSRLALLRESIVMIRQFILALLLTATAYAQSSNQIVSNNLSNPFANVPDTVTLSSKSQYSAKRDLNVSGKLSVYRDFSVGKELILNANALYDDTWVTTSTVTQQYSARLDGISPLNARYGRVASVGESHDNTQGIRFDTFWGTGVYYQSGSFKKNYIMVAAEGGGSFVNAYHPGKNVHAGAAYFFASDTIQVQKVKIAVGSSLTLPVPNTGAWQTAVNGSVSYQMGTHVSATFSAIYDYYSLAPTGFDNNAVETGLGLTYKFLKR